MTKFKPSPGRYLSSLFQAKFFQFIKSSVLLLGQSKFQFSPMILYWVETWRLTWPLSNIDVVLLNHSLVVLAVCIGGHCSVELPNLISCLGIWMKLEGLHIESADTVTQPFS